MNIITKNITIKQEVLTLTNQRCIFWKREKALILSDVHIGKTGHFKKNGIAVPDTILQNDLLRLETLISYFNAERLVIVGDLFHAEFNNDMLTFKNWIEQFKSLEIILIKGNHDRLSKRITDVFNFKTYNELDIFPFKFIHDYNSKNETQVTISGHTHPGILIKGKARQRIKLPCYQVTEHQVILPAFSLFTGLNTIDKPKECCYYAFTEDTIFEFG